MSTPTKRLSLEDQHLLTRVQPPILNQPTGKYRWLIASGVSFGGIGGVAYISIKNFIDGAAGTGVILGAGTLICAGACAYCLYRFVDALRTRSFELVNPTFDEVATNANTVMLRTIHKRLNLILDPSALEQLLDDGRLHESINLQLTDLEYILPSMRQDIQDFQDTIHNAMENRSMDSQSQSALNSPSIDSSYERGLLGKLDDLAKKTARDQSSRSSSRHPSAFSSPIGGGTNFVSTSGERLKGKKLDFNAINGSESDSDKEAKK